jgi:4-hydroxythreonine-4-phosphate dehydrogenase
VTVPRIAVTLGDPRGIGPEVVAGALGRPEVAASAEFVLVGPADVAREVDADREAVGRWDPGSGDARVLAGEAAGAAVERALELAREGRVDGLVTAPLSKDALSAAGYRWPGHTEMLRDVTGTPEVTMMMVAEETPLGGPLRMGLLTAHVPLREVPDLLTRELVETRAGIAARALREWWGIGTPRLAFAGVNPHASEEGLFGDEEAEVLAPAARSLEEEGVAKIDGIHPADTVFRRCIEGRVDAVIVPYHDVGLAVLKTLALETGVNVTAGLPFPRTSPDHGTAFDIAGRGLADPTSMIEAIDLCVRFCRRAVVTR